MIRPVLELRDDLKEFFGEDAFQKILNLEGVEYRSLEGRRTLRFSIGEKGYFAKIHRGVGWREIFKNLVQFKKPVLGAENELLAIRRLEEVGVSTMRVAGFGKRGWNPAKLESFIITEELENTISLETLCENWVQNPPPPKVKRKLIYEVARIARCIHEHGVNHRDFYLCHFLLDQQHLNSSGYHPLVIYLIDLHRVQIRKKTPRRWVIKDLAGLFFSSMDIGLTRRDFLRFVKNYRSRPLRKSLHGDGQFWQEVQGRAVKLYEKTFSRKPRLPWSL